MSCSRAENIGLLWVPAPIFIITWWWQWACIEHLLCATHGVNHLTLTLSFNPCSTQWSAPHCWWETYTFRERSHLPRSNQLASTLNLSTTLLALNSGFNLLFKLVDDSSLQVWLLPNNRNHRSRELALGQACSKCLTNEALFSSFHFHHILVEFRFSVVFIQSQCVRGPHPVGPNWV